MKDANDELDRIENQRRRNQELRMSHEKELQDIQKAIYLVKLDDAREVKNISMEHRNATSSSAYRWLGSVDSSTFVLLSVLPSLSSFKLATS